MKKIIVGLTLLMIATATFSQQTESKMQFTKQDYLRKSKNKKTTAAVLLGGGAGLFIIGAVIPRGELTHRADPFLAIFGDRDEYKNQDLKGVLILTGTVSMLGSIPFFISSANNKRRAMSVSIKNETAPQIQKKGFVNQPVSSITLKICL